MKKKLTILFLALVMAVLAACGNTSTSSKSSDEAKAAEEITVKHELGEAKVKANPKKVVVFDMGILDTLDKLGVEVAGVPQESLPEYLSKYEDSKYTNVGGLKEPDLEAISELAPDVIFISGRQSAAYEDLSEIAPTVYVGVDTTKYMDSFKQNMELVGQIFGKEDAVKKELASIDDTITALNDKAKAVEGKSLVVLVNDGSVSAYGSGSRFGIIHDVFGLAQADENIEASTHGQSISFEYIADKNPEYLFVVDRGAVVGGESSAAKVLDNELVNGTDAAKDGHIIYLNPNYWYLSGGGLVSTEEMAKEIDAGISK
ncbi:siderophore ABC transporter substrate-binding protein [Niallia taxi]|uniref:Siderophore ABC transporter substrate-binding protein n=1 Tax=Niallia taxi TaxID=2499688 RepID=A0A3S2X6A8_9BACI|nr:siderophore ABC transporter substrate-binding protein [Niallia taxi]MDK8642872.1 siderophore ABC transporter substrate-binding protein [Niallia taxi]MED4039563.1 siderophore ABC transporter substrate-binding protein [Niallia taxi]MED4054390.1 siderophore ABC transporter substrate-binding protein [Niallia taxi]MED4120335.1 siderophore ABC transporter substrate-binding protein [Niallia taxi]RVT58566.1 siderophore ABC transporter substrate-binding protein [Niallia taxi]